MYWIDARDRFVHDRSSLPLRDETLLFSMLVLTREYRKRFLDFHVSLLSSSPTVAKKVVAVKGPVPGAVAPPRLLQFKPFYIPNVRHASTHALIQIIVILITIGRTTSEQETIRQSSHSDKRAFLPIANTTMAFDNT